MARILPLAILAPGEDRDLGEVHTQAAGTLVLRVDRTAAFAGEIGYFRMESPSINRFRRPRLEEDEDELRFDDLFEGEYSIRVHTTRPEVMQRQLTLTPGIAVEQSITLRPAAVCEVSIDGSAAVRESFGALVLRVHRADGVRYTETDWHQRWGGEIPTQAAVSLPVGTFTLEASTTSGKAVTTEAR